MLGASLEQKYEKGNDVTVIEPLLGTSIEDFAKAIMQNKEGTKQIVTQFNDFKINSNDFQNAEEIIEAYEKHIQTQSNEKRKIKSKQEKITPAEIESVIEMSPRNLQILNEISATKQLVRNNEQEKDIGVEKE